MIATQISVAFLLSSAILLATSFLFLISEPVTPSWTEVKLAPCQGSILFEHAKTVCNNWCADESINFDTLYAGGNKSLEYDCWNSKVSSGLRDRFDGLCKACKGLRLIPVKDEQGNVKDRNVKWVI